MIQQNSVQNAYIFSVCSLAEIIFFTVCWKRGVVFGSDFSMHLNHSWKCCQRK